MKQNHQKWTAFNISLLHLFEYQRKIIILPHETSPLILFLPKEAKTSQSAHQHNRWPKNSTNYLLCSESEWFFIYFQKGADLQFCLKYAFYWIKPHRKFLTAPWARVLLQFRPIFFTLIVLINFYLNRTTSIFRLRQKYPFW